MKRTLALATTALVALVATSLAVGKGLDGNSKSARAVTGTFTATTASKVETRTCTTTDGKTLVTTNGTYTGTACGRCRSHRRRRRSARPRSSTRPTTSASCPGRSASTSQRAATRRRSSTPCTAAGQIAGLATGHAHDPAARLVANLSAGFTGSGGFTNGKLGGETAGGAAVELGPGRCQATRTVRERSEAHGLVTAVSSTSITVAGLTCAVPTDLQSKVSEVATGARRRDQLLARQQREHAHAHRSEALVERTDAWRAPPWAPSRRHHPVMLAHTRIDAPAGHERSPWQSADRSGAARLRGRPAVLALPTRKSSFVFWRGTKRVAATTTASDGTFRVALAPGVYRVTLPHRRPSRGSRRPSSSFARGATFASSFGSTSAFARKAWRDGGRCRCDAYRARPSTRVGRTRRSRRRNTAAPSGRLRRARREPRAPAATRRA